jgi:hypothetical protein
MKFVLIGIDPWPCARTVIAAHISARARLTRPHLPLPALPQFLPKSTASAGQKTRAIAGIWKGSTKRDSMSFLSNIYLHNGTEMIAHVLSFSSIRLLSLVMLSFPRNPLFAGIPDNSGNPKTACQHRARVVPFVFASPPGSEDRAAPHPMAGPG